jgi:SAM-dependent methyltransferase
MNGGPGPLTPTQRFSDRVANYVRFRPHYPPGVIELFRRKLGLRPHHVIADIGSGTGISSELFLKNGNTVYAVEPNEPMRLAAESMLEYFLGFHSCSGRAEATGLRAKCADFIVAAQAFHWFDRIATKTEFKRILKPGGRVVLLWNDRKTTGSAFAEGYEKLLEEFGTDYAQVKHKNLDGAAIGEFLGRYGTDHVSNSQTLDFDGLLGRLISSSYAPNEDHPRFPDMRAALKKLFDANAEDGRVKIEYDTTIFHSRW